LPGAVHSIRKDTHVQNEQEYIASITLPERHPLNLHWITDDLATGGDLHHNEVKASQQIEQLVEDGVTHIIDMRMEWSDEEVVRRHAPHIKYLHLRTNDAHGYRMPHRVFDEGVEFARQAQAIGGKVLAHCHMGINRGPSMAMAILLDRGMDPIPAFELLREKRDIVGLAYAADALDAHLLRTDGDRQVLMDFLQHEQNVWTPEEVRRINATIRRLHEEARDWAADTIYKGKRSDN
jgi:dual specificity phosphatase 3